MRSHCTQKRAVGNDIETLLRNSGIARLDAELLLAHALKTSRLADRSFSEGRTWLLAHPEFPLSSPQLKQFDALVERRKNHEPVAYIIGEKEFYGRPFSVDRRVMIPRPATEALIDEIKRLFVGRRGAPLGLPVDAVKKGTFAEALPSTGRPSGAPLRTTFRIPHITAADNDIVIFTQLFPRKNLSTVNCQLSIDDIGTGSGCIGITLALEISDVHIVCTDISDDALAVAKTNAKRHNVLHRITFSIQDVTSHQLPVTSTPCLVVSNPPYIPDGEKLPPDVKNYEPREALFAGPDGSTGLTTGGMDVLAPLYDECRRNPNCIGCVLEMRLDQAKKLTAHSPRCATLPSSRK